MIIPVLKTLQIDVQFFTIKHLPKIISKRGKKIRQIKNNDIEKFDTYYILNKNIIKN